MHGKLGVMSVASLMHNVGTTDIPFQSLAVDHRFCKSKMLEFPSV